MRRSRAATPAGVKEITVSVGEHREPPGESARVQPMNRAAATAQLPLPLRFIRNICGVCNYHLTASQQRVLRRAI